jgi:hypothetical protein
MSENLPQTDPIPAPDAQQEQDPPMLDVHPPHEPVHGIRDFLLHILTITIGLLIALSLEAGVEYMHHRHIVAEARENIRQEIEENRQQVGNDIRYIHEDGDRMKTNIETIRALRKDPVNFHGRLQFTMTWSSFNESAWRSSRDMGALSYMPHDEVQRYADLYEQQEFLNQTAITLFTRQAMTATPTVMEQDLSKLPDSETLTMLHETSAVYIGLKTLEEMMQQLDASYIEALKKKK